LTTSLSKNYHVSKIYLSSAFKQRRWIRELAQKLRDLEYAVTSEWQDEVVPGGTSAPGHALKNFFNLAKSDVFVAVAPTARRVWEELGFARASGLKIVMVGLSPSHANDALPAEWYSTEEAFLRAMDTTRALRFSKEIWE
jgi:hypothetical protein